MFDIPRRHVQKGRSEIYSIGLEASAHLPLHRYTREPDLSAESTGGNSQTHMIAAPDYAASRNEGSFADLLMEDVSAASRSSPKIRNISVPTNALKPITRMPMNSTAPTLAIQLWKSHAENMNAPPEGSSCVA